MEAPTDGSTFNWKQIGSNYSQLFKGTFDGGGHTITGMMTPTNVSYAGFFGKTDGATIKNLTLSGVTISCGYVSGCGAVVGYAKNTDISNCTVSGFITSECTVGGIAGYYSGNISNCTNYATIHGKSSKTGGIVGGTDSTTATATFVGCENYGTVTATSTNRNLEYWIGGIAGQCNGSISTDENCYNAADICFNNAANATGYVGPIVGGYKSGDIEGSCKVGALINGTPWDNTGSLFGYSE